VAIHTHLKHKLALAKAAHTALKAPAQMPKAEAYERARAFISDNGATFKEDGYNPQRKKYLPVIQAHDAVLAYRKDKAALANAVTEVQRELYEATQRSDLE
jgi:hypothetical protein